ncbi:uncharacterized protein LOC131251265 isoform X2 [Magnolia sinica]|uniref:uncharacterized protein LOC131251265 isoform X2 n=1 Tax=Magnolia sinica TaxID=86752 RepID=UPI002659A8C5|nr:uncharacterized protein LOC131251265 isoform X2 [Magnolia sinica]
MSTVEGLKYKLKKKLKLAVAGAKGAKNDVKSVDRRKRESRGSEKEQIGKYKMDGVCPGQEMYKRENGQKRSVKDKGFQFDQEGSKRDVGGKRRFELENSYEKRKRSLANRNIREKREYYDVEVSNRRSSSMEGRYSYKGDSIKEKRSREAKPCEAARSGRKPYSTKERKSKEAYSDTEKSRTICNGRKNAIRDSEVELSNRKPFSIKGRKLHEDDSVKDRNSNKHAEERHSRNHTGSLDISSKKKTNRKKGSDNDSVSTENVPRKMKRVMRIDPHDVSNKRIDDSISTNEKIVEEKVELSKNAQFRAIQPSPAILSFVEDNLLGRRRLIELRRAGYNIELSAPLDNIPFSTSPERERIEENVFRNKLTFFAAAKVSSSFPPADLPEIAFAGRSNVGKSSLLNALTRQWGVVRTSDKPGLTQTINFFKLMPKLCLVDLPGYGFAYAKEEVKDAWEELVKEYVSTRSGLKRVCLLIDTKWGMKPRDQELIDLMERSQTKYQIVLTKTDVVFPIDVARRAMQIQESLSTNKSVVNPLGFVIRPLKVTRFGCHF